MPLFAVLVIIIISISDNHAVKAVLWNHDVDCLFNSSSCGNTKTNQSGRKKNISILLERLLLRKKQSILTQNRHAIRNKRQFSNTRWRFKNGMFATVTLCPSSPPTVPISPGNENTGVSKTVTTTTTTTSTTKPPQVTCNNDGALTSTDQQSILREHNEVRRRVDPPATNMRVLTWDKELAWISQQRIKSCTYQERNAFVKFRDGVKLRDVERHNFFHTDIGFNWFAWENTADLPTDFIFDVMRGWMEERRFYNHAQRICSAVCRHYLQVNINKPVINIQLKL